MFCTIEKFSDLVRCYKSLHQFSMFRNKRMSKHRIFKGKEQGLRDQRNPSLSFGLRSATGARPVCRAMKQAKSV